MMTLPPVPPLKSSQRLSAPVRTIATVRAVEEFTGADSSSPPSLRRPVQNRTSVSDSRRLVQGAVRQAAASEPMDSPIIDRPRPRVDIPVAAQSAATRSPPGTRTPVDINWEDGVSYMDQEAISEMSMSPAPIRSSVSKRPVVTDVGPTPRSRTGSFESGKPRGLSFHEARDIMRSGRGRRPGSWHDAPTRTPTAQAADNGEQGSRSLPNRKAPYDKPSISRFNFFPVEDPRNALAVSTDSSLAGEPLQPLRSHPPEPSALLQPQDAAYICASPSEELSPLPEKTSHDTSRSEDYRSRSFRRLLRLALGEFLGTTSFLFMVFGAIISAAESTHTPQTEQASPGLAPLRILYSALAIGIAYMVNIWTFLPVSDGFFNPAVTLALFLTGSRGIAEASLLLLAQVSGSIAASALSLGLFQTLTPARTALAPTVSTPRGLFVEAILTAQIVLVVLLSTLDKRKPSPASASGINGLALCASELVALFWTGGSLNPARSFGPNVVAWSWEATHWIYWAGPMLGSMIAVIVFRLLQVLSSKSHSAGWRDVSSSSLPSFSRPLVVQAEPAALTGVINMWPDRGARKHGRGSARLDRRDIEHGHC